jgi:protein farnesyltransferase subunit beta
LSLKQPDGSFTVHREGEIDVRATYCVTCISIILGIATPELFEGVGEAVARCQTFEGTNSDGATLGEAHGGYAYCALASHLSLSFLPNPKNPSISPFRPSSSSEGGNGSEKWNQDKSACSINLDVDKALRWAISQQGIPIEGGGFRGRTNKLVDGCYGWFSGGGMFSILGALVELQQGKWWSKHTEASEGVKGNSDKEEGTSSEEWESVASDSLVNFEADGCLFDRVALQEYVLIIAQAPKGGLRDKPGKNSDAYHTCYNLSGLSLCQYQFELDDSARTQLHQQYKVKTFDVVDTLEEWKRCCFSSMLGWKFDVKKQCILGGEQNRVGVTHPIFNVGFYRVKEMMDWSYGQL